jgi:hypothetical protein
MAVLAWIIVILFFLVIAAFLLCWFLQALTTILSFALWVKGKVQRGPVR